MTGNAEVSITDWVDYLFDHPVADPEWYYQDDPPYLHVAPTRAAELIIETFERSTKLLRRFSDAQINYGLMSLVSGGHLAAVLANNRVEVGLKQRVLEAFPVLFETTMAERCTAHLSHFDEPGSGAVNSVCYMWWDAMGYYGNPNLPEQRTLDMTALATLQQILAISHEACQESALHGLGHLQSSYPDEVDSIISQWLADGPSIREALRRYADAARNGMVQ